MKIDREGENGEWERGRTMNVQNPMKSPKKTHEESFVRW
jgi:hypothetical protein